MNSSRIAGVCCLVANVFGQGTTGVIILPLVCPLAVKLYAPEVVALMAVMGITCAMSLPFSSSDNYFISTGARDDFRRRYIQAIKVGIPSTLISVLLIITLG